MNVNCIRVTIWEIAIKEKNPIQNIPNKIVPSKQYIQNQCTKSIWRNYKTFWGT